MELVQQIYQDLTQAKEMEDLLLSHGQLEAEVGRPLANLLQEEEKVLHFIMIKQPLFRQKLEQGDPELVAEQELLQLAVELEDPELAGVLGYLEVAVEKDLLLLAEVLGALSLVEEDFEQFTKLEFKYLKGRKQVKDLSLLLWVASFES